MTTATLNTSSRTSELVSKSKVFNLLSSDLVAPPPGFNNNNTDKLQSQPVTTMLIDSEQNNHHPNTTVEFISNDTNDSNKDLIDIKSTLHRVKQMDHLEIVEFTNQNTNDESQFTNDDNNKYNKSKFLTTTTSMNNNDSVSIVHHTITNEIEKSVEQADNQISKTTVPSGFHPSSQQQHQNTLNTHHDHHQKDSSSWNNKVKYFEHEDNQVFFVHLYVCV